MFTALSLAALIAANPSPALSPSAAVNSVVPAATSTPAETSATSQEPERMICVRVQQTGSRLQPRRVCRTRSEWRAAEARD